MTTPSEGRLKYLLTRMLAFAKTIFDAESNIEQRWGLTDYEGNWVITHEFYGMGEISLSVDAVNVFCNGIFEDGTSALELLSKLVDSLTSTTPEHEADRRTHREEIDFWLRALDQIEQQWKDQDERRDLIETLRRSLRRQLSACETFDLQPPASYVNDFDEDEIPETDEFIM